MSKFSVYQKKKKENIISETPNLPKITQTLRKEKT